MMKRLTIALGIALLAAPASAATCPLDRSIYRDGDEKGFELVFGPPVPETPTYATVTIRHPQQDRLYYFSVTVIKLPSTGKCGLRTNKKAPVGAISRSFIIFELEGESVDSLFL